MFRSLIHKPPLFTPERITDWAIRLVCLAMVVMMVTHLITYPKVIAP